MHASRIPSQLTAGSNTAAAAEAFHAADSLGNLLIDTGFPKGLFLSSAQSFFLLKPRFFRIFGKIKIPSFFVKIFVRYWIAV